MSKLSIVSRMQLVVASIELETSSIKHHCYYYCCWKM